jgi:hypothetical protein
VFSTADIDNLKSFLSNGGKLLLSGQDIGYNVCSSTAGAEFFAKYLFTSYVQDYTGYYGLAGSSSTVIGKNMEFSIGTAGDGAKNQAWPDEVDVIAPGVPLFKYVPTLSDGVSIAAVPEKTERAGESFVQGIKSSGYAGTAIATTVPGGSTAYKAVYLAFGIEGITTSAARDKIVQRALGWLNVTVPSVTDMYPNKWVSTKPVTMTLTGKWFAYGSDISDVTKIVIHNNNTNITLAGYAVESDTRIVGAAVPANLTIGSYDLIVTNSKGDSVSASKFNIVDKLDVHHFILTPIDDKVLAGSTVTVRVTAVKSDNTVDTGYSGIVQVKSVAVITSTVPVIVLFNEQDLGVKTIVMMITGSGRIDKESITAADINDTTITGTLNKDIISYHGEYVNNLTGGVVYYNNDFVYVPPYALPFAGYVSISVIDEYPGNVSFTASPLSKPIVRDYKFFGYYGPADVVLNVKASITIPYTVLDIGTVDESLLGIYSWNKNVSMWERVADQYIDTDNNRITAQVSHFSYYAILATNMATGLNNVKIYPNPFNPGTAHDGKLKIINLPASCTVRIYTVMGGLVKTVRETEFGNQGWATWTGRNEANELVADGVYIYHIEDLANNTKSGKLGIIR